MPNNENELTIDQLDKARKILHRNGWKCPGEVQAIRTGFRNLLATHYSHSDTSGHRYYRFSQEELDLIAHKSRPG